MNATINCEEKAVAMDYDSSNKFISSLAKFLQSLCNGYVEFDNGVQVIGHLYLSVDTGKTIDYILNEKVCKTDENSVTFISNSFHAQPAEKPKPQTKRSAKDGKSDDTTPDEGDEPRSTNNGTVASVRASGQNSPHSAIKRPHSPSQRQSPHSKSGRSSPKYRKGASDSFDQNASHPSNPASENSISSAPSPAVDGGAPASSQGLSYSEGYSDSYFNPADEDNAVEGSDRDVKPSLDTDVTFIKEEYGPNSGGQGRDSQGEEQTVFSSNQAYSSMQYSGHFGSSSFGGPRSALNPSGDRSSNMYSPAGSSHLEPGENAGDPSAQLWSQGRFKFNKEYNNLLLNKIVHRYPMNPKRYSCAKCNQSFSFSGNLTRHRKACEGLFDIKCMFCDKVFYRQDVLKVHVKSKHGFNPAPLQIT